MQGAQVQSLDRELRSSKLLGEAKRKKRDLVSELGLVHRSWEAEPEHIFLEDTAQPTTPPVSLRPYSPAPRAAHHYCTLLKASGRALKI